MSIESLAHYPKGSPVASTLDPIWLRLEVILLTIGRCQFAYSIVGSLGQFAVLAVSVSHFYGKLLSPFSWLSENVVRTKFLTHYAES